MAIILRVRNPPQFTRPPVEPEEPPDIDAALARVSAITGGGRLGRTRLQALPVEEKDGRFAVKVPQPSGATTRYFDTQEEAQAFADENIQNVSPSLSQPQRNGGFLATERGFFTGLGQGALSAVTGTFQSQRGRFNPLARIPEYEAPAPSSTAQAIGQLGGGLGAGLAGFTDEFDPYRSRRGILDALGSIPPSEFIGAGALNLERIVQGFGASRTAARLGAEAAGPAARRLATEEAGALRFKKPTGQPPSVPEQAALGTTPPVPPAAGGGKPPPVLTQVLEQAQETVRQDRPGVATRLAQRIPVAKQLREFEQPGVRLTGQQERFLVGAVAESQAVSEAATRAASTRVPVLRQLQQVFGKDVLHGAKSDVPFLGTAEQAKSPLVGTLKDIADRPALYRLAAEQQAAIAALNARNTQLLQHVVEGYGAEIGQFPVAEGGAFLPTKDISEDVIQMLGSARRAVATGSGKTRIWASAADRMAHDATFKPELDVQRLLEGLDQFKSSAAGGQAFRQAIGGLTRLEVMEQTHPALFNKMVGLRQRLQSLRGSLGRLNDKLAKAVDDFLASPVEEGDLADLQDVLNVRLQSGPRAGQTTAEIKQAIDDIRGQIADLRPAWKAANPKPYVFVQEGIYRYFPAEEAKSLMELRATTNNSLLNFMDNVRGTAFSGDLSPIVGVQTPLGALADPIGTLRAAAGGFNRMVRERNIFRPFQAGALADDIAKEPDEWTRFFSLMGRQPAGTPREFVAGFLSKVPGFSAFTEGTFTVVTRQQFQLWRRTASSLIDGGLSQLQAEVAAADIAGKVYPLVSPARLGQSQARASLLRALPTSYSFIRQPAVLMSEAARAYVKMGLKQTLTPREVLAVRVMTTMAVSTLAASATSAIISAYATGKDPVKEALDAINPDPRNGKFASLMVGDVRVPIGGPYRAIFRAVFPQEVEGIPGRIPFAGVARFMQNRLNPVAGVSVDLLQNRDYYGREIMKGDTPEQILRGVAYALEGALPLTAGQAVESYRQGESKAEILSQVAGQFAGVTAIPPTPFQKFQMYAEGVTGQPYNEIYDDEIARLKRSDPQGSKLWQEHLDNQAKGTSPFQKAQTQREQNRKERLDDEVELERRFLNPGPDDVRLTGEDYRQAFDNIQGVQANKNLAVNRAFGVYQEDKRPTDPKEAAVYDYYKAYENAATATGIDFERLEPALAALDASWTPDLRDWVSHSVGLTDHPTKTARELLSLRKRLRELNYWDAEATLPAMKQDPALLARYRAYKKLQTQEQKLAWMQAGGNVEEMKFWDDVVAMERENILQAAPDIDAGLVKFYGSKGVTTQGRVERAKTNPLQALDGIGSTGENALLGAGITSLEEFANEIPLVVARLLKVSEKRAAQMQLQALELLGAGAR